MRELRGIEEFSYHECEKPGYESARLFFIGMGMSFAGIPFCFDTFMDGVGECLSPHRKPTDNVSDINFQDPGSQVVCKSTSSANARMV